MSRKIDEIKADMWKARDEGRGADAIRLNHELVSAEKEIMDWWETLPWARRQEICNAERDGRGKVLPCKVGDKIWILSDGEAIECVLKDQLTYKAVKYNLEIGRHIDGVCNGIQTVFLTCESAEAALKEKEQEI